MSTPAPPGWDLVRSVGPAGPFHARAVEPGTGPSLWIHEVDRPALVLGSAQPDSHVDHAAAAAAGVEVVRRRSGGGAVLLDPGAVLWVDAVVPVDHPLWDPDVGRAFGWLGAAWVRALASLGVDAVAHRGPLVRSAWSDRVCFAGLGPGELTVAGRKVLGISARRTRVAARFQCAVLGRWEPARLLSLLDLGDADPEQVGGEVGERAAPVGVPLVEVERAFLATVPPLSHA